MKRTITTIIISVIACIAIVMLTAEAETATLQMVISGCSMAVLYLCYKALDKMGVIPEE